MKVLVVDSGGRGHAIAWQFKNDPHVKEVICALGIPALPLRSGVKKQERMKKSLSWQRGKKLTLSLSVLKDSYQKVL
jgi:phosphoribosylamine-glycine ligase